MSVAAVMLVRDELDVVEPVLRHLSETVDEIYVLDNMSEDGTYELLQELATVLPMKLGVDEEVGYFQSRKTTALAMRALEDGHQWVVPCDADEIWHPGDVTLTVSRYLGALAPDVMIVQAPIFNHFPTVDDDVDERNTVKRITYRKKDGNGVKVAARLTPDLEIAMGNHSASLLGPALTIQGLNVRHFSWRTPEQFIHKLRVGARAYEAAGDELDKGFGVGWRNSSEQTDDAIRGWFEQYAYSRRPEADDTMTFDPAPAMGQLQREGTW